MSVVEVSLSLETALVEQLDGIAAARGYTRAEVIERACREFVRQLAHLNDHRPQQTAPHAAQVSAAAAALWEASWIDEPIDPNALRQHE